MWCGLERVVHCVGDGWISIAAHVWTEWIPFVDLFLSFYLCSVFSPELISCTPSLPLLQPFFFHSCNNTSVTLASFFYLYPQYSPHSFLYRSHLNVVLWVPGCWRHNQVAAEEKREKKDSWASPAGLTVRDMTMLLPSSYSINQHIFQNILTCTFVCVHRNYCLEGFPLPWMRGCSRLSLMSCSTVQASPGSEMGDSRQIRWMVVVITVAAEGHLIKMMTRRVLLQNIAFSLKSGVYTWVAVNLWSRRNPGKKIFQLLFPSFLHPTAYKVQEVLLQSALYYSLR